MLVEEKPKMELILREKNWDSSNSIFAVEKLKPQLKRDLPIIMLDGCDKEPGVFEVNINIFKNKRFIELAEETIQQLQNIIATIEVESNEEIMKAISQSQVDKREGKTRSYEEIARECGLRR